MKKNDMYTSLIWTAAGLYISFKGYGLKLGTFQNPDSGFFIFLAGVILTSLSAALLVKSFYSKSEEKKVLWIGLKWSKGIKLMVALFAYALVFRWVGFFLSTFLLLIFLFKGIEPQRWRVALMFSLFTVVLCYLIFGVLLELQFPGGILERGITWLQ